MCIGVHGVFVYIWIHGRRCECYIVYDNVCIYCLPEDAWTGVAFTLKARNCLCFTCPEWLDFSVRYHRENHDHHTPSLSPSFKPLKSLTGLRLCEKKIAVIKLNRKARNDTVLDGRLTTFQRKWVPKVINPNPGNVAIAVYFHWQWIHHPWTLFMILMGLCCQLNWKNVQTCGCPNTKVPGMHTWLLQ